MRGFFFTGLYIILIIACSQPVKQGRLDKMSSPGDWFFLQRNYPDFKSGQTSFRNALLSVKTDLARQSSGGWNHSWTLEGPANTGGRINCMAIHPSNSNIMYAGSASGGIFKTTDAGMTWFPVFDDHAWLAVSTIVLDPSNPDVIYAGTGDKNISFTPFIGDGVYKSTDGGSTWNHVGLTNATIVSNIVIDPLNTNIIYAATMGIPFEKNNDRGVYKSIDGGLTWNQSLFVNDSTGAIDLLINPQNPQILYAATWNRIRNNHQSLVYGPDAGIYKSTNGGGTWTELTIGLPAGDMSRIGLTMSTINPDKIWAVYIDNTLDIQGIYRTDNGGSSWTTLNTPGFGVMGGFGWYFGRIQVSPVNDNELWLCAVDIYKTTDGGNNWSSASGFSSPHADKHDIIYKSPNNWILATDGGIYETPDGGQSWSDIDLIPNNQFYRITYNPHIPGHYTGGVQDNGTNTGNAFAVNNWQQIYGADGFQTRYHPFDPDIFYVEWQNGNINVTTDGGLSYSDATSGIDPSDRRSWDMPYIMNQNDPDELYTGTYRIYKNSNGPFGTWTAISPDLTDGVIFGDRFHTITAVGLSEVNSNYIIAGTSDGNVWISTTAGVNWNNVTAGLPDHFVTSVHFSPNTQNLAYATHSGYKENDFIPHVYKTTDNGATWTDISGNLPQLAVNDLLTYPGNDSILFVATDGGVYGTVDAGISWNRIGNNLPVVAVFDIDLDPFNNKLLAGTFARSMWSYPVDSILVSSGMDHQADVDITAYPSPAVDFIYISGAGVNAMQTVDIYSVKGDKITCNQISEGMRKKIDISNLSKGVYFITLESRYGKAYRKFVKY
jgi:photosystem II stability/assembly factor-like uncharacterized protein